MAVQPLGDRQAFYDEFLAGCKKAFGMVKGIRCTGTEADRIEMRYVRKSEFVESSKLLCLDGNWMTGAQIKSHDAILLQSTAAPEHAKLHGSRLQKDSCSA